jgi:hypothetical protein
MSLDNLKLRKEKPLIVLLHFVRVYVVCIAVFGFLFGELFSGDFSLGATAAGIGGILSGALSWSSNRDRPMRFVIVLSCVLATAGVGLNAYEFYEGRTSPGDYYAWFLIAPFLVGLLAIGIRAGSTRI